MRFMITLQTSGFTFVFWGVNPQNCVLLHIIECGSTLYAGLTGTFQTLIQKSGMVPPYLFIFPTVEMVKRLYVMNK